ncbi:uncharacterized protein LOC144714773 [Wolffia australiana]
METAFLLWPAAQDRRSGGHVTYGGAAIPPAAQPGRAARPKKKAAGPKRPPQRGLGVEQLERLRLQEHWKKMAHAELAAPPAFLYHVAPPRYRAAAAYHVSPPLAAAPAELPSTQTLHCSDHCDLCVRTKRLLGEKGGVPEREMKDPLCMDGIPLRNEAMEVRAEELKERMFFPLGERARTFEEPPASLSPPIMGAHLDLSLKLSI